MGSSRRASSSSGWPWAEKRRAVARPMPELAPVMMTSGLFGVFMVELQVLVFGM